MRALINYFINNALVTKFLFFALILGGVMAYFSMGKLENPEFTIKVAAVTVMYPGASLEQTQKEVAKILEENLKDMPEVDYISSSINPGRAVVFIHLLNKYKSDLLPQVWDTLRKKVNDIKYLLPQGASEPIISDDWGDTYGFLIAVTSNTRTNYELYEYAKKLKVQMQKASGIKRIIYWGNHQRYVYVDIEQSKLSNYKISISQIQALLSDKNKIVNPKSFDLGSSATIGMSILGSLSSQNLEQMVVKVRNTNIPIQGSNNQKKYIKLSDIANVYIDYNDPVVNKLRYNGESGVALGIAVAKGVNIPKIGENLDKIYNKAKLNLPEGINLNKISWQSDRVNTSIKAFVISLSQSVGIVFLILSLSMGLRMGLIIGYDLMLTIIITCLVMSICHIHLHALSFGALIIALGMMVDNSIVVAESIYTKIQHGVERKKAALDSAAKTAFPLLGATIIASFAFFPIYLSNESIGEYCAALFTVVGISLSVSWFVSMFYTPVQCIGSLKVKPLQEGSDPYGGKFYKVFKHLLNLTISYKYIVFLLVTGLLVFSMFIFTKVDKVFFPDGDDTEFSIDFWAAEGVNINYTDQQMQKLENYIRTKHKDIIVNMSTFVGEGPPSFRLGLISDSSNPAYGQIILSVVSSDVIDYIRSDIELWAKQNLPNDEVISSKYGTGPASAWKVEYKITAPNTTPITEIRSYADSIVEILKGNRHADHPRNSWRNQILSADIKFNDNKALRIGLNRTQIAESLAREYYGINLGVLNLQDEKIPLVLRNSKIDASKVIRIDNIYAQPANTNYLVPLSSAIDGVEYKYKNNMAYSESNETVIHVRSKLKPGSSLFALRKEIDADVKKIEAKMPEEFQTEWAGEAEASQDAQSSLLPGAVFSLILMVFVLVALFNSYKIPAIIMLLIIYIFIGVSPGLLITHQPFGFLSLLGVMSLSGMMIKNSIILIEEVEILKKSNSNMKEVLMIAAISRVRPIFLAATTTLLGVIPLLTDVLWVSMAVTIMSGLAIGTLLSVIFLPTLYAIVYRVK